MVAARPIRESVPSVLVAGAGISGLSAALLLARRGAHVEVWESGARAGGLLEPVTFRGVDCDRGSHRVHLGAHPLLLNLTAEERWQRRPRRGRLVIGGRQIEYPPTPLSFLRGLGPAAVAQMGLNFVTREGAWRRFHSWEADRRETSEDLGFERFVVDRVGKSAYRRFYRPYVEKVWGQAPHRLSQTVAKQRVSMSSPLRGLLDAARPMSGAAHFLYPQAGMGALIGRLRDKLASLNVPIHCGRAVTADSLGDARHERILFSGNLSDLRPRTELVHRGLYLVHLAVPADAAAPVDTFYVPDADFWFGRVSRIDRFSSALANPGEVILCVEIPEGRWGRNQDFAAQEDALVQQLHRCGALSRPVRPLASRQTFVPHVYPEYRRGWRSAWRREQAAIAKQDRRILPIGRQGLFLHCNMDHCVRISSEAVHHVLEGRDARAWHEHASAFVDDLRVRD